MANGFFFDENDFNKAMELDRAQLDEKINNSLNER